MNTRLVSGEPEAFEPTDKALRPQTLAEFVGQEQSKANLKVFIDAARQRGEALDHVLLFGPPGLGKTTLAQIVSRELGVNFRATSGPVLAKAADLGAILTNLEPRDVLFIDEIHRLAPAVEDVIEPFLMQQGFIQRTPRGRMAAGRAYLHLGLTAPTKKPGQGEMFEE